MRDDLIGKQLGGYEIIARLGQGGMASVYRARQTSMNRTVALKILPRHLLRDEMYLQRFEREVKIVAQLEHRNIVPVHDYGEHDGQPYIAMRYMPAGSVDDLLAKGPIDPETMLKIIQQIAPALDYAHGKSVLHRDLKPSNILMDDDGGAYITDFGIARILGADTDGATLTTQGVVGTPSYMSPEQAQGQSLDGRSDLYSLGVMLFEMATGRRPFENETPYGIAVMQVTAQPPIPRSLNPKISGAMEQVILKAMKKRKENRYQTAAQFAEALRLAVEEPGSSLHDTQPRPLPVKQALEMTQPSTNANQYVNDQTVPHTAPQPEPPPIMPPPPAYTPVPHSQSQSSVSGLHLRARVRKRRKQGNFWVSIIIGAIIGCGLLTGIAALGLMVISNLLDNSSPITGSVPTLDPTSEAGRQALFSGPGITDDSGTPPVFTNVTPIPSRTPVPQADEAIAPVGVRPTATFPPDFVGQSSTIVYFADRDGSYDIYQYNLRSGVETRLTNSSATNSYPRISPNGARMVFQSDRSGVFDIYVMTLSTRQVNRLTDNGVRDRLPAWSSDGEWIIFSSDTRGDGTYDLYRVRADGSEPPELVYSDGNRNSHARFSRDGRSLVFTTGEPGDARTWEIVRLELSSGEMTYLTDNDVRDSSPSFSPDDEQILYVTAGDGGAAIAVMSADGTGSTIIYDGPGFEWGMSYSDDGAFIIFNEEIGGVGRLYIMRADGTGLREIENEGGFYPSWIP